MKKRLKNYGLWMAVAAFVLLIAQTLGYLTLPEQVQQYHQLVNGLLGILVLLGILNNPTTQKTGYGDDLMDG
ncbi:MAG: holin [Firmicutes bacterium]|nr:holin [Bacillota bacterium]